MKVLLAAASFASSISGIQRHALNVARCLLLCPEITELHFVVAPWQCDMVQAAGLPLDTRLSTHVADMGRGSLSRNLWYYRRLPGLAAQLQADVVHFSYPMPLNAQAFHCPTIATLHDLYPFEIPINFGFVKSHFNRLVLRQCLRAANAIACVSEATRTRLKQYAPASVWQKAIRIYNCVESGPFASAESPIPGWKGEPFLLCIAQHRRNKNIHALIRAFDYLLRSEWVPVNAKLVVIGMRGPETGKIERLVDDLGLDAQVHFLEGLLETELQWCYQNCDALVAPSLTEGFGLPVAEAVLAGCRIVCSDIPAHQEIGNRRCRFVTLRENAPEALAAAIADTLREPRPEPSPLPELSAAVLAEQYMALYRKLIHSTARARSSAGSSEVPASGPMPIAVSESQSALAYRGK
jgi:glycosyltransferase involved in cell wall biosynthesis